MDWKVLTVWECEISSDLEGVAREIIGEVRSTAASQPPEA
jgi:G:T-mismatch repair DNA endonuclease (very short patch repair protein)